MALYTPNEAPGSTAPSRANIWAEIRKHSQIVPIANAAGRTALLASLAGLTPPVTPTPASPVWAYRQDTQAIESTTDGATWATWAADVDSGWIDLTLTAQWAAVAGYTPRVRRVGGLVRVEGMVKWVSGAFDSPIATVPAGLAPSGSIFVSTPVTSDSKVVSLTIGASGALMTTAYYRTASPTAGANVPLLGSWLLG